MKPLERILAAAKASPRHIVLPEGEDPRVVEAALHAVREGIAQVTLVGRRGIVEQRLGEAGAAGEVIRIEDPETSTMPAPWRKKRWLSISKVWLRMVRPSSLEYVMADAANRDGVAILVAVKTQAAKAIQ